MRQKDKVKAMLQDAGPEGVHTFELRASYIANPSQRIAELEEDGNVIHHRRERLHGRAVGTRYTLIKSSEATGEAFPNRAPEPSTPVVSEPPALFPDEPVNAIFGAEAA